jgi:ACS family glucarate transporter-like MFS transporter
MELEQANPPLTASVPTLAGAASRTRYLVVGFAVALAVVQYIDRVCISQAAPLITADFRFSPVQMGYVFAAFTWAYSLFEIPGGWLGDKLGPRRVLTRVVLWWSFFTAATGWTWSFLSLLVTRALFGAGEAGCFPNITKAFTTWLPSDERVKAQSILWLSARWGGAFTPLIVVFVLQFVGWRRSFEIFGLLGVAWAVAFFLWFRDDPREHPGVNAAERALLTGTSNLASADARVPWRRFLAAPTTWLLWGQYFCLSYGWYFYPTWLPSYLQEARGQVMAKGALLAGLPLFFGGIGCLASGWVASRLARRIGPRWARQLIAALGFTGAALLLLVSMRIADPTFAMLAMGLASFCNDLVMPPAWGACMDVGGRFAGTYSGSMNMMGNLGGVAGPIVVGYILQATGHDWALTFYVSAAVYLLGALLWLFIDPVTPLDLEAGTDGAPAA